MLEIEEIMPIYICQKAEAICPEDGNPCFYECHHTSSLLYAKNKEAVDIFNKFCDTFHVFVDDYGRLVCTEKGDFT